MGKKTKGLPCHGCAYRSDIPGDSHSRCTFDWQRLDLKGLAVMFRGVTPRNAQWFHFPFNYDPLWGPDECPQRSETGDSAKKAKANPLADLLSLLR